MSYKTILTDVEGKVATITLNRPEVLNALNDQLMDELGVALLSFDADDNIGCIIVTGSEKAFAAGADIASMAKYGLKDVYRGDFITRNWEAMKKVRKPVIAAVSGYALGGNVPLVGRSGGHRAICRFPRPVSPVISVRGRRSSWAGISFPLHHRRRTAQSRARQAHGPR